MSRNKYTSKVKNVKRRHQLLTTWKDWTTEEKLTQLQGWARSGMTDAEIAMKIGIKRTTIYSWKKKSADIANALKKGKEVVDYEVENSLLDCALGKVKSSTTIYKMVRVEDSVLKAQRFKYANIYKLDHPEATKQEIAIQSVLNVPTWQKIPIEVIEKNVPPDVRAAIFWLKNRKPKQFRDKSFQDLNEAQTAKAIAEVAKIEAETKLKEAQTSIVSNDQSSIEFIDDLPNEDAENKGSVLIHDSKPTGKDSSTS